MGKTLEFALTVFMITTVNTIFAFFVGTTIGQYITDLFEQINNSLTMF